MIDIYLSWQAAGTIDSFTIYKSTEPFNENNLPEPLATEVPSKSYNDQIEETGVDYYYRIASVRNGVEKLSDTLIVNLPKENEVVPPVIVTPTVVVSFDTETNIFTVTPSEVVYLVGTEKANEMTVEDWASLIKAGSHAVGVVEGKITLTPNADGLEDQPITIDADTFENSSGVANKAYTTNITVVLPTDTTEPTDPETISCEGAVYELTLKATDELSSNYLDQEGVTDHVYGKCTVEYDGNVILTDTSMEIFDLNSKLIVALEGTSIATNTGSSNYVGLYLYSDATLENARFKFTPTVDGTLVKDGNTITVPKNLYLTPFVNSVENPTVQKDEVTGVITGCIIKDIE